jgi:toxin ParE1/3/4
VIVVITAEAEADLEQIAAYVAEQSPRSALTLVRELRDRCESLLDTPRGYPLVPRYEHLGIRRRPFGRFLIFYRVGDDTIEVIHVLHGARDYEALLFPEE